MENLAVLFVEPSKAQHRIIESHFNKLGVREVVWVRTAKQALDTLKNTKFDLVISAMHLEDMTGTDLILKIRTGDIQRNVPYMLISSETNFRYLEPIRQAGAIGILPKPFKLAQLQKTFYAVLDYLDPGELDIPNVDLEEFRVLLVDDSETSRRILTHILTEMGLENITQVHDGREALAAIEIQYYDLIVTDFHMPEMDGKELIEHIRKDSPQSSVPILMVSGENNEQRLAGVRQAGVSAICDKPFETNNIKQLIEKIVA